MPGAEAIDWLNELPSGARLRMDPDDFGEIAGNILDNARKHARATARISLQGTAGSEAICFDDDGPGIPSEDRERIIRRGERATGEGEGSGLGLAIVIEALAHYGVALTIDASPMNGCRMSFPAVGFAQPLKPAHQKQVANPYPSSMRGDRNEADEIGRSAGDASDRVFPGGGSGSDQSRGRRQFY
jgi:signal transduction histidine kinase